jgi:hypothetical protein
MKVLAASLPVDFAMSGKQVKLKGLEKIFVKTSYSI